MKSKNNIDKIVIMVQNFGHYIKDTRLHRDQISFLTPIYFQPNLSIVNSPKLLYIACYGQ